LIPGTTHLKIGTSSAWKKDRDENRPPYPYQTGSDGALSIEEVLREAKKH